jgi:hypothetical protein
VIEALFDKIEATIQIGMRLPNSEHESRPWRIAEIAPDFRLEDVWALPARGGAEDFEALLEVMASLDPAHGASVATRLLFSIRYRLGGWFGWDNAARELAIPGDAGHRERAGWFLRGLEPIVLKEIRMVEPNPSCPPATAERRDLRSARV